MRTSLRAGISWVRSSDASICAMERSLSAGNAKKSFGFGTLSRYTEVTLGTDYEAGASTSHCD